jgi:hypothetical protein
MPVASVYTQIRSSGRAAKLTLGAKKRTYFRIAGNVRRTRTSGRPGVSLDAGGLSKLALREASAEHIDGADVRLAVVRRITDCDEASLPSTFSSLRTTSKISGSGLDSSTSSDEVTSLSGTGLLPRCGVRAISQVCASVKPRQTPMEWLPRYFRSIRMILHGSKPIAAATSMYSSTSKRRSPPSYLAT